MVDEFWANELESNLGAVRENQPGLEMAALRKSVEWPSRVGDAEMRFLGDSSQLDSKFAEVKPIAERAFRPCRGTGSDERFPKITFAMIAPFRFYLVSPG
jgi:hypothetical protein